jgi:hypothetical protein
LAKIGQNKKVGLKKAKHRHKLERKCPQNAQMIKKIKLYYFKRFWAILGYFEHFFGWGGGQFGGFVRKIWPNLAKFLTAQRPFVLHVHFVFR